MSKEHDILKSLLLKEELLVLDKLKHKVLSEDQFTQEVSQVLSTAIKRAQLKDKSLDRALSRPIKSGIERAFSDNKQSIVDSMLPIMGQLIRKTVTNSIKQFVADINRTLELKFSLKSLKWRWDAKKAGITFAEMVFQKTINYKVTELFVINRENGLLIHHVGENATLVDNNAISAMLTAIQDFIADSLQTSTTGLSSGTIGDISYFISTGPKAYLATFVKGSVTERLNEKSQELIENIHAEFSQLLSDENRYQNDDDFDHYLNSHLISKSISNKATKVNWLPWVVILLLLISYFVYWINNRQKQYSIIYNVANSTPGFVLQSIERKKSGFSVVGLLDPDADITRLQQSNINITTKSFLSLDPEIIQIRVFKITESYDSISTSIQNSTVTITGTASINDTNTLINILQNVVGIDQVINKVTVNRHQEIRKFINNYSSIINTIDYEITSNKLILSGILTYQIYQDFKSQLSANFPEIFIVDNNLSITDDTATVINEINNSIINIPKLTQDNIKTKDLFSNIVKNVNTLIHRKHDFTLIIIGQSDCQGNISDTFSTNRALFIKQKLTANGINPRYLDTDIKACQTFTKDINPNLKNVTLKIK